MKFNKTLVIAALAAGGLVACGSVRAQDATSTTNLPAVRAPGAVTNGMPRMRGPNVDRMGQALGLTDQQKTQIQPILNEQYQKIRAVIQDNSLSRDDKRSKIMDIRKDTNDQLKSILTPEQYQKWTSMQTRFRRAPATPATGAGTNAPSAP